MKNFALDVWHDLRAKRLWPVAVVLVLALVAVPVLLLKGPPEASLSEGSGASTSPKAQTPAVSFDETSLAGSSKLGAFDEKNPFRSLADPEDVAAAAPGASGAPGASALAGGGADSLSAGGSSAAGDPMASSGASPGGSGVGSSPGAGGSGSSEPAGSDSDSGSGSTPQPSPEPPTPADPKFYEYVLEVDFGRRGDERRYRDVRALDSLPRKGNPVVVYLGQTRDDESAFLVNQAIGQGGEGNCVPNTTDCSIVYLRPRKDQNDHYFQTGPRPPRDYHLKLIAVRRKVDGRDPSARSSAKSSESLTPTSGKRSKQTVRRTRFDFRIPMIAGRRR